MNPVLLPNNRLLVTRAVPLPDGAGIADIRVEIGTDDPEYAKWMAWIRRTGIYDDKRHAGKSSSPSE